MNFKISGFVGFTRGISSLDFMKVTWTYIEKTTNVRFFMRTFFIKVNK